MGLEFAPRLGFEPKTNNVLDRFGTVVVPNQARCQITSLTKSAAPTDEKKTRKPTPSNPWASGRSVPEQPRPARPPGAAPPTVRQLAGR